MLKRKNRGYYQVAGKHFIGPNELLPWDSNHPVIKAKRSNEVRGLIILPGEDSSGFQYAWAPSLKLLPRDPHLYVLTFDRAAVSEADAWLQVSDYLERGKKVSQLAIVMDISLRKRRTAKYAAPKLI